MFQNFEDPIPIWISHIESNVLQPGLRQVTLPENMESGTVQEKYLKYFLASH